MSSIAPTIVLSPPAGFTSSNCHTLLADSIVFVVMNLPLLTVTFVFIIFVVSLIKQKLYKKTLFIGLAVFAVLLLLRSWVYLQISYVGITFIIKSIALPWSAGRFLFKPQDFLCM